MQFIPYNSRDTRHKSIFGSIAAGESLRLQVLMPRSFSCSRVTLVSHKDGEGEQYRDLFWCGMNGDCEEWWDINLTFENSGLYYYHFTYETPFGRSNIFLRSGGCGEFAPVGNEWQLTVHKKDYVTPQWVKGGIMYQIFPDRFNRGNAPVDTTYADRIIHADTSELPCWEPDANGKILNNDYFGGTLKGIEEKLPYLRNLGVTMLYLNPIFEAHSNHRYNTADYMKIDPMLGTEQDFKELCKSADEKGIKIILDGVFSHTGSDSIYFNRAKRYPLTGAYNTPESPYRDWFTFKNDGTYESWWGIDTLPETNEDTPSFIEYISGKNGVIERWLKAGAYGFRLDVADELPDKFIDELNKCIKGLNNEYFIVGEVWEDASNKISHGGRRRYLLGDQLDSVMNYPFASAIVSFMRYGVAESFMESVVSVCENYPKPALNCLMNHIGTHDTARIITSLIYDSIEHKPRSVQVNCTLTEDEYNLAKKLLKSATVLQYTLPGFPSVYYGDEAGMQGGGDPFNRGFFPWGNEDTELADWYKKLGALRHRSPSLKDGAFIPFSAILGCVAYKRSGNGETLFVIVNRNNHDIDYYPPDDFKYTPEILHGGYSSDFIKVNALSAVILRKTDF